MGAAYIARLAEYSSANAFEALGHLVTSIAESGIATQRREQIRAWTETLRLIDQIAASLRNDLAGAAEWFVLFEYEIPRRARRPDVILLARDLIFVIEFKIGADKFHSADRWQARNYALNLRDFHEESKDRTIVPVLIASDAAESVFGNRCPDSMKISPVQCFDIHSTANRVAQIYIELSDATAPPIDAARWINSSYKPTPTIVEAAQLLFSHNQVTDISHSFATNLTKTTQALVEAISKARVEGSRTICFVTGIPGAGKTLAGLNAAHDPALKVDGNSSATFLSGNGPLIAVIHESLVRDAVREGMPRQDAEHRVSAFIHDGHRFMQQYCVEKPTEPPPEHIVIFDEAQRAWDAAQVKKKRDIERSEADLILDIMERAPSWAVVIALVGGGQEINAGEAGLEEWGQALRHRHLRWNVLASPETLIGGEATAGHQLFLQGVPANVDFVPVEDLHLASNVRSARAQWLGSWVNQLLTGKSTNASVPKLDDDFPFVITRSLKVAKNWVKKFADPEDRIGLLASSGALRLRSNGIEVSSGFRGGYPYTSWFLEPPSNVLSSNQLEVAATEFESQGLEIDWSIVCWGGDLIVEPQHGVWKQRAFRGSNWTDVHSKQRQTFILNKYRVLMTRARRGMVVWVPPGSDDDSTTSRNLLDATARYLMNRGLPSIDL